MLDERRARRPAGKCARPRPAACAHAVRVEGEGEGEAEEEVRDLRESQQAKPANSTVAATAVATVAARTQATQMKQVTLVTPVTLLTPGMLQRRASKLFASLGARCRPFLAHAGRSLAQPLRWACWSASTGTAVRGLSFGLQLFGDKYFKLRSRPIAQIETLSMVSVCLGTRSIS